MGTFSDSKSDHKLWHRCAAWLKNDVTYSPRGEFVNVNIPSPNELADLCTGKKPRDTLIWLIQNIRSKQTVRDIKINILLQDSVQCIHNDECKDADIVSAGDNNDDTSEELESLKTSAEALKDDISELLSDICQLNHQAMTLNSSFNRLRSRFKSLVDIHAEKANLNADIKEVNDKINRTVRQLGITKELTPSIRRRVEACVDSLEKCVDKSESALDEQRRELESAYKIEDENYSLCANGLLRVLDMKTLERTEILETELQHAKAKLYPDTLNIENWKVVEKEAGKHVVAAAAAKMECDRIEQLIAQELKTFKLDECSRLRLILHSSEAAKVKLSSIITCMLKTLETFKKTRTSINETKYESDRIEQDILEEFGKVNALFQQNKSLEKVLIDLGVSQNWEIDYTGIKKKLDTYDSKNRELSVLENAGFCKNKEYINFHAMHKERMTRTFLNKLQETVESVEITNETCLDRIQVNGDEDKTVEAEDLVKLCEERKMDNVRLVNTCKYANEATIRATLEKIKVVEKTLEIWWSEPGQTVLNA